MNKNIISLIIMMMTIGSNMHTLAQERQYLHNGWTFGEARLPHRYPAVVPGVVHTDLMRVGLIDDPYIGLNERKVQWVDKEDWMYETTFQPSNAMMKHQHIDLCFEGLDTYADVYLNDTKVVEANNMFRRWRVDAKSLLKSGDNVLRVYFHSPAKVDMPKWEAQPYLYGASNDQSENGGLLDRKLSVFARKAGYHYGWDWGPRLVTCGIWRDVYLEAWDDVRISNIHLRQRDITANRALLSTVVEIMSVKSFDDVTLSLIDVRDGVTIAVRRCHLMKGRNTISVEFAIKEPRLWWCNGLGKSELYTFSTRIAIRGELVVSQQGTLELSVYTLDGEMVCHRDRAVTIPANTAAIVARLPLDDLLDGHPREEVFIHIGIATRQGFRHEGNYFLCRQKDLRWSAVAPQFQVEGIDGGCRITVRSDKLVRALCLSIDDGNTWLDDNYMDILPNVPTQYIVHTPLTTEEVRRRLTFHCINQMRTMASEP